MTEENNGLKHLCTDSGLIVTKEEFFLLGGLAGIRQMFGFPPDKVSNTKEEITDCLFRMTRDGILIAEERGLCPNEELQKIFSCLTEIKTVLCLYGEMGCECFYSGEKTIRIRENEKKRDTLVVEEIDVKEALKAFAERPCIPACNFSVALLEEPEWTETEQCFMPPEDLLKENGVLVVADRINGTDGRILERLILQERGIYPELVLQTEHREKTGLFSRNRLAEWMIQMAEEEKL